MFVPFVTAFAQGDLLACGVTPNRGAVSQISHSGIHTRWTIWGHAMWTFSPYPQSCACMLLKHKYGVWMCRSRNRQRRVCIIFGVANQPATGLHDTRSFHNKLGRIDQPVCIQLSRYYPLLWNEKIYRRPHKIQPSNPNLAQFNPAHSFGSCPTFQVSLYFILPFTPRFRKLCISSSFFGPKFVCSFSFSSRVTVCPVYKFVKNLLPLC
jgi:hypothetical protein